MKDKLIHYIIRTSNGHKSFGEWRTRKTVQIPYADGRPTSENLSKWRDSMNKSFLKGGSNEHIGIRGWIQERIEIYDQFTGSIVATFNPPMFEVIP